MRPACSASRKLSSARIAKGGYLTASALGGSFKAMIFQRMFLPELCRATMSRARTISLGRKDARGCTAVIGLKSAASALSTGSI